MEADIRVQCLIFILRDSDRMKTEQALKFERKLRSNTTSKRFPRHCTAPRTLRYSKSASVPLGKAFVMLPEVFLRDRQSLLALFQRNDILIVNPKNVSRLLGRNNYLEVIEILLDGSTSASVDPLYVTAPKKFQNLVKLLFSNVKVQFKSESKNTVIRPAVDNMNSKYLKSLLKYGEVHLEFAYDYFWGSYSGTLLHMALIRNNADLACSLVKYGANAHRVNFLYGDSTLHLAAKYCPPLIQLLIDKGVPVDIVNRSGASPLHYASTVEATEILLQNGANLSSVTKQLMTPLMIAVECSRMGPLRTLLQYGANVYARDNQNRSVFELAYRSRKSKFLKLLFDYSLSEYPIMFEPTLMGFYKTFATEVVDHNPNKFYGCAAATARHILLIAALKDHSAILSQPRTPIMKKFHEELVRISRQMLGGSTVSLCDILTKSPHQIACLLRHKAISRDLESRNLEAQFPLYGSILKYRLEIGKHRKDAQEEAVDFCSRLFKNFKSTPGEVQGMIVRYLNTQDVQVLKRVFMPLKTGGVEASS